MYCTKLYIYNIKNYCSVTRNVVSRKLSRRTFVLMATLSLFSCAQEQLKTSTSTVLDSNEQTKLVSKADREQYRKCLTALNNNEFSKAQRLFSEFIRNKPKLSGAYSNLALIHLKKNEYKKSLKQVNKALELNPDQAQALNIRAQLYILDGKIHEAKDDYLKAVASKPDYINAQYNLALLYDIYLQEIKLAVKHYKLYLSLLEKPDETTEEWVTHLKGILRNG